MQMWLTCGWNFQTGMYTILVKPNPRAAAEKFATAGESELLHAAELCDFGTALDH
jgi:hypothetical protein